MAVHRGRLLRDTAAAEFVLFAVAVVIAVMAEPMGGSARVDVAFVLAVALGLQNTSVRRGTSTTRLYPGDFQSQFGFVG